VAGDPAPRGFFAEDRVTAPRVVIAVPLYGHNAPGFVLGFTRLLERVIRDGVVIGLCPTAIPYIDQARNQLVRDCLEYDPTHIFWLDHDVIAPPGAVSRLLERDVPVVGGMYHSKDKPFGPVAFYLEPKFDMLQEVPPEAFLHLVGGVGMGATLVRASVYRLMAAQYGDEKWYETRINPSVGEDVHFAQRLQEMAIPVFLDPTVECGHIRDQVVGKRDYLAAKREHQEAGV
jgi:hypothetical protein